jgi:uncharacterized protein (TIGR03083 family)
MTTPPYEDLLAYVDDRSRVLRAAIAGHLDAAVPGCPGWTGWDLVAHLGEVERFWAAAVTAGPAAGPPVEGGEERSAAPAGEDVLGWLGTGTDRLLAALRSADPDLGVWTWWGEPATAGAVARHQAQEAAVHGWDAQSAAGRPEPVPADLAADAVDEFLHVTVPSSGPWPHAPATVGLAPAGREEGWSVRLGADGGSPVRGRPEGDAVVRGEPSALLLALYGRSRLDTLEVTGDRDLAARFLSWPDTT